MLGETVLSALGLVWMQHTGVLIKYEGCGAQRPEEGSQEAASYRDEIKSRGDHQMNLSAGEGQTGRGKPDHSWDEQRVGGIL